MWFTSVPVGAAALDGVRALRSVPHAAAVLATARGAGLDVKIVEIDSAASGSLVLRGRLDVGRRRWPVEVRLEPWSHDESRLRLGPARRGVHRHLPGPRFYDAAHGALIALHDILLLIAMGVETAWLRPAA